MLKKIPVIDMVRTGKRMKELRISAGLSVHELQIILGVQSPQSIYKWERGTSLPSIEHMLILSGLYGVKIREMLGISYEEIQRSDFEL